MRLPLVLTAIAIAVAAMNLDSARVKEELTRFMLEKKQRSLRIDGDLSLSFWPSIGVKLGQLSLSERNSDKPFAALESARVSVQVMPLLQQQLVIDQIELVGLKVTLLRHKDGTLNIADLLAKNAGESDGENKTEKTGGGRRVKFDIAGIKLANAQLGWRDELSGQDWALSGLNLTTGRLADTTEGKLELLLDAKAGETALQGKLQSTFSARLSALTIELPKFSGEISVANPRMPMKQVKLPISGTLRADLAKHSAEVALNTQFDESKLAAKFSIARFASLALGFDLDIDKLNVDQYLPPKKEIEKEGEKKSEKQDAKAAAEAKLDLSALRSLNLHGVVKIGMLQAARVKVADLRLNLKAAGGQLDIAPHSASLYHGRLSGAFSLNANGNRILARENLSGVDINPLMKDAVNQDLLEGRGDLVLDIATQGETVPAMKRALNGTASLSLKDGAIKGINLAQAFRSAKAKISGRQDAVQAANTNEKTDFAELAASFKISNGVANNNDLMVKSPFLRLSGSGDVDLGQGAMNYLAKASLVNTSGGQGAKDLEALQGMTVPVRVSGPFEKLSYKLEFASLAQEAIKARVAEKQQEIRQKAQDAIKDKLKGLFGK
ncbi:MAG: AsmA family protein [Proteobacteria bacterium]|nr:AsmA family protein [Pseudomonadota bacterium]